MKKKVANDKLKLKSRIGFKLIVILILLTIIPITSLGIVSYISSKKVIMDRFKVSTEQTLSEVNRGIDNYFDSLKRQINILASNENVQAINTSPAYQQKLIDSLSSVKENNRDLMFVYLATSTGKLYSYPNSETVSNVDCTNKPWYTEALKNKDSIVVSDLYKDEKSGQTTVTISRTVQYKGDMVGVLAMDIDMNNLANQLSNIKIGKEGYVFIINKTGIVISHPDNSKIGTDLPTKMAYWKNVSTKESGFEQYTYLGEEKYNVYVTNKESSWKILGAIDQKEIMTDIKGIGIAIFIFTAVSIVLSTIIAVFLSMWITKNINRLNEVFRKAADGDLTSRIKVKTKDEFGQLGTNFNNMLSSISLLIKSVKESSGSILETSEIISNISNETNSSVSEVASAVDSVAMGASNQTKDIEDGVSKFNELEHKIDNIVKLTNDMGEISSNTEKVSREGLSIVDTLSEKSRKTIKTTSNIQEAVLNMSKSTNEIGTITETINDIAEQTNLLALNAAIEAARAGDAGRGFAVVADEIRKLAEQSTDATKRIQQLIEKISTKSKATVDAMQGAAIIVNEQNTVVDSTKQIFGSIISSINELINGLQSIETAVKDANDSKSEIVGIMHNIAAVSEESAASTEQVSASIEEVSGALSEFMSNANSLKNISLKLQDEINKFSLND
ncbi:methyl-accepting chemotaxis protein signaling domain protein [Clostridiales bacterium oral taxon 876 str. F0540]|nr:methyl-accepting chemotaxis protein signaling domain protein [Clostridiales bacterium oral taxon 876 str. F0540]